MKSSKYLNRPRILLIGPTSPYHGGMSAVTKNILDSHFSDQFEIILLDISDRRSGANVGQFEIQNIILAILYGTDFLRLLLFKRPDIVYISIARNFWAFIRDCLFLIPTRLFRKKLVVHLHGGDLKLFYESSSNCMRWLIRWSLCRARRAIVSGNNLRDEFFEIVPEKKIVVIPNGIKPISSLCDEQTHRTNFRKNGIMVSYLSAVMQKKGFMDVLKAIPLVVKEEPSVRFILAGEQVFEDEMREAFNFIKNHKIEKYVELPGPLTVPEKIHLLTKCDIFTFPPVTQEGHPIVILEAMSAGLPIIATAKGAISETVIDGFNGFIVPSSSPESIAEKILMLSKNDKLRLEMGKNSRELYVEKYTYNTWIDNLSSLFQEVADEQ